MKITCHACDAKYTIADEKVTGRTVKIKCKKCGATIVVAADQAAGGGATGAPPQAEPQAHGGGEDDMMATRVAGQDGAPPAITAPEWTVSIAEGQEQQMSQLQLAEAMQRGMVTGDTYVWRDGMPDWLSVSQVPELAALLARAAAPPAMTAPGGYAAVGGAPAPGPVEDEPQFGLAGTMVMTESPLMSPMAAAPSAPRPAAGMPAVETPAPSPGLAAVNQPTAARRANRAERPSVDVFQAAAEGQPQREPEKQRPKPPTPAGRLGERNENSVLFSLSALTATENAAKSGPGDDAIDLGLGGGSKNGKSSAVDDLMNIGGGAIGGPMLAPPPLLAPVVEPPPAPAPVAVPATAAPSASMAMGPASFAQPAPQPKSKTGLVIGIVAAVAVIGGVGAFFALSGGGDSGATTDTTSPTASVTSAPASTATSAPATTSAPAEAPSSSADASPSSSAVASNDSSKTQGTSPGSAATSTKGGTASTAAPTASAKASAAPTSAPTAAPTATDTGAGGGRDFNKGAATTALSAAAGRARGCKTADGPTGSASVRVVFAPSGNVTSANVQGPPFAGTPVGGCIAAAFRGASVPPFDGSPVAVTKTVNIN